jgi:hypothetical protein
MEKHPWSRKGNLLQRFEQNWKVECSDFKTCLFLFKWVRGHRNSRHNGFISRIEMGLLLSLEKKSFLGITPNV